MKTWSFGVAFLAALWTSQMQTSRAESDGDLCGEVGDASCFLSHRISRQTKSGLDGSEVADSFYAKQHVGFMKASKVSQMDHNSQDDEVEQKILNIIQGQFGRIAGGSYLLENQNNEHSWNECSKIDWSKTTSQDLGEGTQLFRDMEEELGIKKYCWPGSGIAVNDPTCEAIFAFVRAVALLQKEIPHGPKFYNAFVVDWGQHQSWQAAAVGKISYDQMPQMPPKADVKDANGMNGYALCDILRTILTQSSNQYGMNYCSHMSSLAALSHMTPAQALKMALRLWWTGRAVSTMQTPCDYVFARQPGIVPWKNGSKFVPADTPANIQALPSECRGNEADCEAAEGGPIQPAGLPFIWTQALISSYSLAHQGTCSGRQRGAINYPGFSGETDGSGTSATALWACNQLVDPIGNSCRLVANLNACGAVPDEVCMKRQILPLDQDLYQRSYELLGSVGSDLPSLSKLMKDDPDFDFFMKKYFGPMYGFPDVTSKDMAQLIAVAMEIDPLFASEGLGFPSADETLLEEICKWPVAMISVDSIPLLQLLNFDTVTNGHILEYPKELLNQPWYTPDAQRAAQWTKDMMAADPIIPLMDDFATNYVDHYRHRLPATCGHSAYLESCSAEKNEYVIWTWGKRVTVSKEFLIGEPVDRPGLGRTNRTFTTGILCKAIVAHRVTQEEEVPY